MRRVAKVILGLALTGVAVYAIANGLATYLFTGEMPHDKDFLAMRIGGVDEDGKPRRWSLPGYIHDFYSWATAPACGSRPTAGDSSRRTWRACRVR